MVIEAVNKNAEEEHIGDEEDRAKERRRISEGNSRQIHDCKSIIPDDKICFGGKLTAKGMEESKAWALRNFASALLF